MTVIVFATTVFATGVAAAAVLIPLLIWSHLNSQFRIWPTPSPGSWQSRLFWTLFRALNVAALGSAALPHEAQFGLPPAVRLAALVGFALFGLLYGYALLALGKSNTYCNRDGLVTHGIYRWTRNPQYATIIPVYIFLALADDGAQTYLLCAALVAVYWLMALVEEPWLEAAYGAAYRSYCRRVPRFFNWHRAGILALGVPRRLRRLPVFSHVAGPRWRLLSTGNDRKHL